jgi:ATP-dependent DNA ligase
MPPVAPMLARLVPDIPPDRLYEPKWDGFRAIVFRDGDEVEIGSRNERPITRYFPEVAAAIKENLPPRCVLDGEIVVAGGDGLDFWALQQRIHPADSRVRMLAERTPAGLIAFDLLAVGDEDFRPRPFAERREALERALAGAAPPIHITPITRDPALAREWFERFEGAGLDGLIAKDGSQPYQPNKRVMAKIKHERTADCVVAGYRVHKSGAGTLGSLLLGIYDQGDLPEWAGVFGGLAPVGVIGAFPMARRRELFSELQPLVCDLAVHPWHALAGEVEARARRSEASRWNPDKDLSFVPLRPERVVEVRYGHMEGFRFRHPAQFVRWRPDREPGSCDYSQLEHPVRFELADVLAGRLG